MTAHDVLAGTAPWSVDTGNCLDLLRGLPDASIHLCITSPPYYAARDYGTEPVWIGPDNRCPHREAVSSPLRDLAGKPISVCRACRSWNICLGLEPEPEQYLRNLLHICAEIRRVLRPDGLFFLNLGDSYADRAYPRLAIKPKDLLLIPARVALALQEQGWIVRQDNIWHKPAPVPENVNDRTTRAHEYVFQLAKSPQYFYDHVAIAEPVASREVATRQVSELGGIRTPEWVLRGLSRNRRSVWTVPLQPYASTHSAQFPRALVEPCVLAGSSSYGVCGGCAAPYVRQIEPGPSLWDVRKQRGEEMRRGEQPEGGLKVKGDEMIAWKQRHPDRDLGWQRTCSCATGSVQPAIVLDPFLGSGTSSVVSLRHGRRFIGFELSAESAELARTRIAADAPIAARRRG